jgi:hypothetical protein
MSVDYFSTMSWIKFGRREIRPDEVEAPVHVGQARCFGFDGPTCQRRGFPPSTAWELPRNPTRIEMCLDVFNVLVDKLE